MPHKYQLSYDVVRLTVDEARESGKGACDAIFVASLIYPEDGSLSIQWMTADGREEGRPLSNNEVFKVWAFLAHSLSLQEDIGFAKKTICAAAHETIAEALMGARDDDRGTGG